MSFESRVAYSSRPTSNSGILLDSGVPYEIRPAYYTSCRKVSLSQRNHGTKLSYIIDFTHCYQIANTGNRRNRRRGWVAESLRPERKSADEIGT
jgi:hypothetical protein